MSAIAIEMPIVTPIEEKDVCYICLEPEIKYNAFYNTHCGCTGSVKIHKSCYDDLIFSTGSAKCCICKRDMIEHCLHSGREIKYSLSSDESCIVKYTVSHSGKKEGVYYEYFKDTRDVRCMMEYSNGLLHGEMSIWRKDGSIHLQGEYVRGMRHGQFMEFEKDHFMGYTITIYFQDNLIEYYRYNHLQEQVDYEHYGHPSMNALAAELDSELGY
jgi:antitoxin component YwqK of YwqJK toxin-antitoxin module